MYCKYCGEEIGNSKYCPNCGHKQEQDEVIVTDDKGNEDVNNINENNINEPEVNENKASDFIKSKDFKKKNTKKNRLILAIVGTAIFLVSSFFMNDVATDDDYIGCAKTIIVKVYQFPYDVNFYEEKVLEKDDYGRALVGLAIDSKFEDGSYFNGTFAVLINSYDKKTGEFTYTEPGLMPLGNIDIEDISEDILVYSLKKRANWDEPLND